MQFEDCVVKFYCLKFVLIDETDLPTPDLPASTQATLQNLASPKLHTLMGVVFVILNKPGQSEVCNLADLLFPHQYVGCPQIPVNVFHLLNERHS